MTRRRLLWAGAALLAVTGLGWLLYWSDPVNRVKPGMTLAEVETLFGLHPTTSLSVAIAEEPRSGSVWYSWAVDSRRVDVEFAAEDSSSVTLKRSTGGTYFRHRVTIGRTTGRSQVQGAWPPLGRLRTWLGW